MGSVHQQEPAAAESQVGKSPTGRFGRKHHPLRHRRRDELEWQLPLNGELYRLMPGPDRPDYSLLVLRRPLHFYPAAASTWAGSTPSSGSTTARAGRWCGCMRWSSVHVSSGSSCSRACATCRQHRVRHRQLTRARCRVDFAKIEFAGAGYLTEGHAERPPSASQRPRSEGSPEAAAEATRREPTRGSATTWPRRRGAAARCRGAAGVARGAADSDLHLGGGHRLAGLSGNADGEPPVPTPETFDRLNGSLRVSGHPRLRMSGPCGFVSARDPTRSSCPRVELRGQWVGPGPRRGRAAGRR